MLRRVGPQKWVWEELRDVEAMQFRFTDKTNPEAYVSSITPRMIVR
jgi:secreted Zn-dependent insulinase-like peptidase